MLREYYDRLLQRKVLSVRQHDLLCMLLERKGSVTLGGLFLKPFDLIYRTVSERTARRDLEKLVDLGLLVKSAPAGTAINFDVLS